MPTPTSPSFPAVQTLSSHCVAFSSLEMSSPLKKASRACSTLLFFACHDPISSPINPHHLSNCQHTLRYLIAVARGASVTAINVPMLSSSGSAGILAAF